MAKFEKLSVQEKIDTREKIIKDMRALNDSCKGENGEVRSFSAEENEKYKAMSADVAQLTAEIAQEKRELEIKGFTSSVPVGNPENKSNQKIEDFRHYLRTGEIRETLVVDSEGSASVLAPQELAKEILAPVEDELSLLGKVRTIRLRKAASLGVPYESADASDADWTTETPDSITADSTWAFDKRELGTHMLVKLITVSRKTLETNAFDIESLIAEKLRRKVFETLEKAIITGDGTGKPLGLFVASNKGLSTARDIPAASATALTGDDIIKTKRGVKSAYRSKGSWLFHPDTVTKLLLLKDSNGQYLWRSGLAPNAPDILDGSPVIESSYVPSTMAAGNYIGMFGDYSKYWMTLVDSVGVERLAEKYYPSIGFSMITFADGQPVVEEAFSRLKMAAS